MPYPVTIDPKAVRALHTKLWQAVDQHLLWAFTPQGPLSADDRTGHRITGRL